MAIAPAYPFYKLLLYLQLLLLHLHRRQNPPGHTADLCDALGLSDTVHCHSTLPAARRVPSGIVQTVLALNRPAPSQCMRNWLGSPVGGARS